MLRTLDDLITALQAVRLVHPKGGEAEIAIHDADTDWHLVIQRIRPSMRRPERLLLEGDYHAEGGRLRT